MERLMQEWLGLSGKQYRMGSLSIYISRLRWSSNEKVFGVYNLRGNGMKAT